MPPVWPGEFTATVAQGPVFMRIIFGVTGGIAAYKAADLARSLVREGHEVQVVLTRSAEEFISPITFASLTGRKVLSSLFEPSSAIEHIDVAQSHDLLLVAPATANTLAEFAHGLAGGFLSTLYLAFRGPVVLAPAMNSNMWEHDATRANLETLRRRGHVIVEPDTGLLACGTVGPGRLAENEAILEAVRKTLNPGLRDLEGETILITAGPTQEPIDPVRYISNRSSGKMGYALAQAALDRGAKVILVSGPVVLDPPRGAEVIRVRTAAEMREAVFTNLEPATAVIKCAAVADFRPAVPAKKKMKKKGTPVSLELEPVSDILAELGRAGGNRLLVGFAAETENVREYALRKLNEKNCDMIVANQVGLEGTGFESDTNEVMLVLRGGTVIDLPRAAKREIAEQILGQMVRLRHAVAPDAVVPQ
jgi:phosphopantothenoylcysteine decarboxylase/phosphopantothenate--cysteine ligase